MADLRAVPCFAVRALPHWVLTAIQRNCGATPRSGWGGLGGQFAQREVPRALLWCHAAKSSIAVPLSSSTLTGINSANFVTAAHPLGAGVL